MKVVVLCSGGMDSVTALHWARARHDVRAAVSFDYGAKHNHREIPLAAEQAKIAGVPHTVIPLDFIGRLFASDLLKSGGDIPEGHYADANMQRTVVPFRNGIMLAAAAGLAESISAEGLVIAAHGGDHAIYPDCREEFMQAMGAAMKTGTYAGIELLRPFIALNTSAKARGSAWTSRAPGRATRAAPFTAASAAPAWSAARRSSWRGSRIRRFTAPRRRCRRSRTKEERTIKRTKNDGPSPESLSFS